MIKEDGKIVICSRWSRNYFVHNIKIGTRHPVTQLPGYPAPSYPVTRHPVTRLPGTQLPGYPAPSHPVTRHPVTRLPGTQFFTPHWQCKIISLYLYRGYNTGIKAEI